MSGTQSVEVVMYLTKVTTDRSRPTSPHIFWYRALLPDFYPFMAYTCIYIYFQIWCINSKPIFFLINAKCGNNLLLPVPASTSVTGREDQQYAHMNALHRLNLDMSSNCLQSHAQHISTVRHRKNFKEEVDK